MRYTKKMEEYLKSNESEDYRDANFAYLCFEVDNGSSPTWQEVMNNNAYFEVSQDVYNVGDGAIGQYVSGFYDYMDYGDIVLFEDKRYIYYDTKSLTPEIEHQAEDGSLAYEYRGSSFMRLFKPVD